MFRQKLLKNWTDEQIEHMRSSVFVAEHRLTELDLFTDEALARLLDRHPRKDLRVSTMGSDPARPQDWQAGDASGLDGRTLVEVAKQGRLWLELRRVMDHHPQLRDVVNTLYDELETLCDESIFDRSASLHVSSPTALDYCHLDCPTVMLWQIRGEKRVWAYPLETGVVSPQMIEAALTGEGTGEQLTYRPELDQQATLVHLKPGQMITWPQHTPHRSLNTKGLNVSLSTEHLTRRAERKNNVYLANRHFRRLIGRGFSDTAIEGPAAALKEAAIRIVRRLPFFVAPRLTRSAKLPITFRVNPRVPSGVASLDVSRPTITPLVIPAHDSASYDVPIMG